MLTLTSSENFRFYDYTFVQNVPAKEGDHFKHKKLYHFKSSKTRRWYLVWIEVYNHNMYGVKFHLKSDGHSKNKYNRLSNLNEVRPVVNTCIAIMYELGQSDSKSSFGFIGSNSINEEKDNTKRYRIYKRMMLTYFSDEFFEHIHNVEKSTYMMIRRSEIETKPDLIDCITNMFSDFYEDFS